jgi:tryptophan-rich sensory protein
LLWRGRIRVGLHDSVGEDVVHDDRKAVVAAAELATCAGVDHLYAMMAIAVWLVWLWLGNRPGVPAALAVFAIQLAFNTAWSLIFFGMHRPGAALVDIVVLWLAIVLTIVLFWNISRTAAWLLVPYLAWVTFAMVLNGAIWRLNSGSGAAHA